MWGHWIIILGYSNIINSLNIVTQMEDAMLKRADHEGLKDLSSSLSFSGRRCGSGGKASWTIAIIEMAIEIA